MALALAALAAALLLAAVVGLLSAREPKGGARAVTAVVAGESVYQPLPEITADLRSTPPQLHYVQLTAVIEIAGEDADVLQAQQQLIIADLQLALRDLSRQDLAGAAGSERARALLTRIVALRLVPARPRSVLFTRLLVD
ncbi:MAG: flagellar basal body-associated FliL family protein [Rhodospirillales bacterium]